MAKKSSKSNGQHWYQVHKAKAGDASVARSAAVQGARAQVQKIEVEVQQLKVMVSETLGASLRRLVFGRNPQEEQYQQALTKLEDARRAAALVERETRRAGEKAYGSDWADRNPDKARNY